MTKYNIIVHTPSSGADILESYDTPDEALNALKEIIDPENLNPFYDDLVALGGYLRLEDTNGGEF